MEDSHTQDPCAPGGSAHPSQVGRPTPRRPGVLVVDDQEFIRFMLNTALSKQGFAVWLAADGQEAIEIYGRHSQDIDLVLLDVRMPGLDGPQTLAILERLDPKVRCCFMSGDLGSYTYPELARPSVVQVLAKPFRLDEVTAILVELERNVGRES